MGFCSVSITDRSYLDDLALESALIGERLQVRTGASFDIKTPSERYQLAHLFGTSRPTKAETIHAKWVILWSIFGLLEACHQMPGVENTSTASTSMTVTLLTGLAGWGLAGAMSCLGLTCGILPIRGWLC
jgi:hypothetical protein